MVGNEMRCLRRGNDDQVMNRTRASDPSFPRMCSAHGDSRTAKAPDLEDTPHGGCEAWDWWEPGDDKCRVHERFYSAPAPGIRASAAQLGGPPQKDQRRVWGQNALTEEAGLHAVDVPSKYKSVISSFVVQTSICDQL